MVQEGRSFHYVALSKQPEVVEKTWWPFVSALRKATVDEREGHRDRLWDVCRMADIPTCGLWVCGRQRWWLFLGILLWL